MAAAQIDHRRSVVPWCKYIVCRRAAGLQVDVFDEMDCAVYAIHHCIVRFDPLRDGDVTDVGAEEEKVG